MRLRVLHITPSLAQGGAEKLLFDLVSNHRPDTEPHVVTLLESARFFPLDSGYVTDIGMRRVGSAPRALCRLREQAQNFRPDVIHSWLYHGNFASLFAADLGAPIVWSIHSTTLSVMQSKVRTRLINRACAYLSHFVPDRIIYCAASARIVHEAIGYDRARGTVIANGIDTDAFTFDPAARQRLRDTLRVGNDEFLIGCVGRLDPQKNHPLVIEAFARVTVRQPAKLVLVGRGCDPNNASLQSLLARFDISGRAICLGERRDMPAVYSALDLLVIGSAYGEAMPLVAIEAAAIGLPIVTTNIGDVGAFVLDPAHVLAEPSPATMAAAIIAAHERAAEHATVARRAERRAMIVRDYSLANCIARYEDTYRSAAARAPAPSARSRLR